MSEKKRYGRDKAERKLGEIIFAKNAKQEIKEAPKYVQIIVWTVISIILFLTLIVRGWTGIKDTTKIDSKKIENLTISMETDKINKEKGVGVKIEVEPKDAYVDDLEWIITNKDIAEVKNNIAYGKNLGKTTIKLSNKYISSNELTVSSVNILENIEILNDINEISARTNHTYKFKYHPEDAINKEITIESSNPDIIEVTDKDTILSKKQGSSKISFKDSYGKTIKESIINVKWKRVTAIELDEKTITIGKGQKYIAYAKVTPDDATYTDIVWKSETQTIATVDKYGIIKGEAVGTTEITAKVNDENIIQKLNVVVVDEKISGKNKYISGIYQIYSGPNQRYDVLRTYNYMG